VTQHQQLILDLLDRVLELSTPVIADLPKDCLDPRLLDDLQGLTAALHTVLLAYRSDMPTSDEDPLPF